jgi:hypothetical protein
VAQLNWAVVGLTFVVRAFVFIRLKPDFSNVM